MMYIDFHTFRENVAGRLKNVSKQLSIDARACLNTTNVSMLGGIHTLDLSWCRNITDVSMLGRVHTLKL